jgi:hypothetical protein
MKTSDMLTPRISTKSLDVAHRMRKLMGDDLDEYDMADKAREMALTPEQLHSAWPILTSTERAAWKQLLKLERPNEHGY